MDEQLTDQQANEDVTIPVYREDITASAVPVVTGGVRVTKHTDSHEEIVEQQLHKSHAAIKRVQVNRPVDGPQQSRRVGNTLIIPVVSEVLRVEKQWVVTEEIHITETEEVETTQQPVQLTEEHAIVERVDADGRVVATEPEAARPSLARTPIQQAASLSSAPAAATGSRSILNPIPAARSTRKLLQQTPGILNKKDVE